MTERHPELPAGMYGNVLYAANDIENKYKIAHSTGDKGPGRGGAVASAKGTNRHLAEGRQAVLDDRAPVVSLRNPFLDNTGSLQLRCSNAQKALFSLQQFPICSDLYVWFLCEIMARHLRLGALTNANAKEIAHREVFALDSAISTELRAIPSTYIPFCPVAEPEFGRLKKCYLSRNNEEIPQ
jgi:hypothetical protein